MSIFFFFIILGVRQAGIVILITLAPVAIVCYALPNTKSFFDRWKKMFTALLLVYPICGLLMGGGQFASTLLLVVAKDSEEASAFFTIVAMLLSVVPFFMIPSILKNSMSMMGNLGMKISNFGRGIGGGATRAIRNSEIGRDIQRTANKNYLDRAADKIERRQGGITGRIKPLQKWRQGRLERYNTMYNRYSYEDIRAGGTASRIKPGTSTYESLIEGQKAEQFDKDVSGRQDLLKNGAMARIAGTGNISSDDEDGMITELDGYLERIIDGVNSGMSEADLADDVKNAQAIMNTLSATGRGSVMGRVENSFARAMHNKQGILMGASGDMARTLTRTFGSLGARTMRQFGKDYKKNSLGAAAMFSDIARGNFSQADTFHSVQELNNDGTAKFDSRGAPVEHLASSYYSGASLSGINTEDLSKLKPHHLSNILDGLQTGSIAGSNALDLAQAADDMLTHPGQFSADADAKAYIERIRSAALTSGHIQNGSTRTTGSLAIGQDSTSAINGLLNSIQGAKDWRHLSAAEQAQFGQAVANIHDSLNNDMHTSENIQQLKQALTIAKNKGFIDSSTNAVVSEFTGTPTLKITHGTAQKAPVPPGWTAAGMWVGSGSPTKQQQIAYEEWAKHSAEIDRRNSSS